MDLRTAPLGTTLPTELHDLSDWEPVGWIDKSVVDMFVPEPNDDLFYKLDRIITDTVTVTFEGILTAGSAWAYFNIPPQVWHQHYRMRHNWPLIRATTGLRRSNGKR